MSISAKGQNPLLYRFQTWDPLNGMLLFPRNGIKNLYHVNIQPAQGPVPFDPKITLGLM